MLDFEDEGELVECEVLVVVGGGGGGADAPPVSAFFAATSYRPFATRHQKKKEVHISTPLKTESHQKQQTPPPPPKKKERAHTIRLTRIPHHHAAEAHELGLRLRDDARERRRADVARARGRRVRGRADVHLHGRVRRHRARPRVPCREVPVLFGIRCSMFDVHAGSELVYVTVNTIWFHLVFGGGGGRVVGRFRCLFRFLVKEGSIRSRSSVYHFRGGREGWRE